MSKRNFYSYEDGVEAPRRKSPPWGRKDWDGVVIFLAIIAGVCFLIAVTN